MTTNPRAVIDEIRKEFGANPVTGGVANNRLYKTIEASVGILAEDLNSEASHFILEAIQNADDLVYPEGVAPLLEFVLKQHELVIISNEIGFTEENVSSLCAAGLSSKKGQNNTTGEKGIGFKSIFKAVDEVTISSNGFHFQFSKKRPCGMVIPEWVDLPNEYQQPQYKGKTVFLLKFSNNSHRAKVKQNLQKFDSNVLLFLRRLRVIEIEVDGKKSSISRTDAWTGSDLVTTLRTEGFGAPATTSEFVVVSHTCVVNVKEPKRQGRQHSTVSVAFPSGRVIEDGVAFNFLPICPTSLPFMMHADFLLVGSREALDNGHEAWNQMLFGAIAVAFCKAVERFHQSPQLRYTWLRYLPYQNPCFEFRPLVSSIQQVLREAPILLTQAGDPIIPRLGFSVPSSWLDHWGPLVEFPGLKPANISTRYSATQKQFEWLSCREPTAKEMLERLKDYLNHDDAKSYNALPLTRHATFAQVFLSYTARELQDLPIVPLQDGRWVAAKGKTILYPRTSAEGAASAGVPQGLPKVEVLHQKYAAAAGHPFHTLYTRLGVKQGSVSEICKLIKDCHGSNLPPSTQPDILAEHLSYLFRAWKTRSFIDHELDMWLLNLDNIPVRSRQMYLPTDLCRSGLPELLGHSTSARNFMHKSYSSRMAQEDKARFSEWLFGNLNVFGVIRISANNELTASFTSLLQSDQLTSMKLLDIIVDAWPANFSSRALPFSVAEKLKALKVASKDGKESRLDNTFLPTKEVRAQVPAGLPFLDVADPEAEKWQVLDRLGVVTQITSQDSSFWLRILGAIMKQPNPRLKDVVHVYQRLEQGSKREEADVRQYFSSHPAIFLNSQNSWVRIQDCVWESTIDLRYKWRLSPIYHRGLENFFTRVLWVRNAGVKDLVDELERWSSESDPGQVHLKTSILAMEDLYKTSQHRYGEQELREVFSRFRKLKVIPVKKLVNGMVVQDTAAVEDPSEQWYFSDSEALQEAFEDRIWLADLPQEESIKFSDWIKGIPKLLPRSHLRLTEAVMETSEHSGKGPERVKLTELVHSRTPHFAAVATFKRSKVAAAAMQPRLKKLAKAHVYSTTAITTRRTITKNKNTGAVIEGKADTDAEIMFQEDAESIEILVLSSAIDQGRLPPRAADCLSTFLGLTEWKHIHLISQIMTVSKLSQVRDLLAQQKIFIKNEEDKPQPNANTDNQQVAGALAATSLAASPIPEVMETHNIEASEQNVDLPMVPDSNTETTTPTASGSSGQSSFSVPSDGEEDSMPLTPAAPPARDMTRACNTTRQRQANVDGTPNGSSGYDFRPTGPGLGPHRTRGGNRALDTPNINSDKAIGAKGELIVYQWFQKHFPGLLSLDHWTSELRHDADPSLPEWLPPDRSTFFADFTFYDQEALFADWLFDQDLAGKGTLPEILNTFHIEVKSTKAEQPQPFELSDWQWEKMVGLSLANNEREDKDEAFVVFRVSGVFSDAPHIDIIPDIFKASLKGELKVRLPGKVTVYPSEE